MNPVKKENNKDITMKQLFLIICILEAANNPTTLSTIAKLMSYLSQNVKK